MTEEIETGDVLNVWSALEEHFNVLPPMEAPTISIPLDKFGHPDIGYIQNIWRSISKDKPPCIEFVEKLGSFGRTFCLCGWKSVDWYDRGDFERRKAEFQRHLEAMEASNER